jgi:hypothetical protein
MKNILYICVIFYIGAITNDHVTGTDDEYEIVPLLLSFHNRTINICIGKVHFKNVPYLQELSSVSCPSDETSNNWRIANEP